MASQDYPWASTTPNNCRFFEYVKQFDLQKLLTRRRVRKQPRKRLSDVLSPEFTELIAGLLAFDPTERTTLGEMCYASGPKASRSIKSAKWLGQR
mmetsp:Transcript_32127/g.63301  ORF Transcript_32127/g.63301 Transcript_32127/m.63301 type:complete len:95 (+) Transcript_32127:1-285(+)